MSTPAYITRARLLNAEATLAHYGEWTAAHLAGDSATAPELADLERVIARLRDLRAPSINAGPAATNDSNPAALVTSSAAGSAHFMEENP